MDNVHVPERVDGEMGEECPEAAREQPEGEEGDQGRLEHIGEQR